MIDFAVVVPVHNKERHIERTLRSIFAQTLQPSEIILVDDASTDGSMAKVKAFNDRRIRLFRRDLPGPGGYAARNLAISEAQSSWVAFLDADDAWHPVHLENLSGLIEHTNCVSAFSGYEFVEPGGLRIADKFSRAMPQSRSFNPQESMGHWLNLGCPMWTGAVAAKRSTLIDTGMFPDGRCRRGGDRDLWLRLLLAGPTVYSHRTTAIYHRDADNMLTRSETFSARQCVLDTILDAIPKAEPQVQDLLKRIFNREVYQYASKAWKAGTPISDEMIRGFFHDSDRQTYLRVMAMKKIPLPVNDQMRQTIKDIKASVRRRLARRHLA